MKRSVLVVGHADADGHLITEQVRRNLALINAFDVKTVVDPARTKDHKSWTKLDTITEIADADFVFFVDLMFASTTLAEEADALVEFVNDHPEKNFFLIDHHPLPLRRLEEAENLRAIYRPEVFECAIGPRSGIMVVAALCENQGSKVADIKGPIHETLALGMRRAAALGGELPGEKLLALLKSDCWPALSDLGKDDREFHRLPRGRRPVNQPRSEALKLLELTASELLMHDQGGEQHSGAHNKRNVAMAYDLEVSQERYSYEAGRRTRLRNTPIYSRDLETIITLLEVAALSLTTAPGATFTREQLIREAREVGGDDVDLSDEDINIVLQKQGFLERIGAELRLR